VLHESKSNEIASSRCSMAYGFKSWFILILNSDDWNVIYRYRMNVFIIPYHLVRSNPKDGRASEYWGFWSRLFCILKRNILLPFVLSLREQIPSAIILATFP